MHCIGVDVSKQELVTFDGKNEHVFPNIRGLTEFRRFVLGTVDAFIVFEPTSTYSRRLEAFCRAENIRCCQPNPRVVPHLRLIGRGRSKTDSSDAELLYRYGIERGYGEAEELTSDALAQELVACLAWFRVTQKARVAYQGLYEALENDPATSETLLAGLRGEITDLKNKEVHHIGQATAAVSRHEEAGQQLQSLLSIPGIGPITALTLLSLFRKHPAVSRSQIVALVGLDPIQFQSGTSIHRKAKISKRGNRTGTQAAVRSNALSSSLQPEHPVNLPPTQGSRQTRQGSSDSCSTKAPSDRSCHLQERRCLPASHRRDSLTSNTASAPRARPWLGQLDAALLSISPPTQSVATNP